MGRQGPAVSKTLVSKGEEKYDGEQLGFGAAGVAKAADCC